MKEIEKFFDAWHKVMYIMSTEQKRKGIGLILMTWISAGLQLLGISVVIPFMYLLLDKDRLMNNEYIIMISRLFGIDSFRGLLFFITIIIVTLYVIKNGFLLLFTYLSCKYSINILKETSLKILDSYVSRGYSFFRNSNQSILLRGCVDCVGGVQAIVNTFMHMVVNILSALSIILYMVIMDYHTVFVAAFLIAVLGILTLLVFRKLSIESGKKYFDKTAANNKNLLQLFNGIKEIIIYNKQKQFIDRYKKSYEEYSSARIIATMVNRSPSIILEVVSIMVLFAYIFMRLVTIIDPVGFIPVLAALGVATVQLLPILGAISSDFNDILYNIPMLNDTYENMRAANEFRGTLELDTMQDRDVLTFEDYMDIKEISFRYFDAESNIIDKLSLSIAKGESVAFVGPSGSGKSTLSDLILGVMIPQNGDICLDGRSIYSNRIQWSHIVGYVPQMIYLLDDTVRNNIAFGDEPCDIDDDKVWEALRMAQLDEYIKSLPYGLDTVIGERGVKFSGGQGQRLSVARALYRAPEILILDEATSALDNETEYALIEAIEHLKGVKTIIMIAHRLSTVKNCDRIFEINNGEAIERKFEEIIGTDINK